MANIIIVSTTNSIQVDFGVYGLSMNEDKGSWRKEGISMHLKLNHVEINVPHEKNWCVSHNGNTIDCTTFQIDLIDAGTPSSLADLYTKLIALIA